MKISFSLIGLLVHLLTNAQNDPELFPVNDRKVGYFGYYLKNMTNIVKPQFCTATYNIDGYYIVSTAKHEYYEDGRRKERHIPNTEKFGLLNSKGEFIVDFKNDYDGIYIKEGIIYIIKNNLYGTLNDQNKIIIPIEYDHLNIENKNVIVAKKNNKYGILNHLGKTVISFEYDFIDTPIINENSSDFVTIAEKKGKTGVINQNNEFIVPFTDVNLHTLEKSCIKAKKNKKFGLLDYKLNQILPFEFETLKVYDNKVKAIKNNFEYYYTLTGKLIERKSINNFQNLKEVP